MFDNSKKIDDVLKEIESTKIDSPLKKKTHSSRSKNFIYFEELDEDSDLMSLLKTTINDAHVKYQALYDEFGRSKATNMLNGIKKGQISWDRFKDWLRVIGKKPTIVIINLEDEN